MRSSKTTLQKKDFDNGDNFTTKDLMVATEQFYQKHLDMDIWAQPSANKIQIIALTSCLEMIEGSKRKKNRRPVGCRTSWMWTR